MLPMCNLKGELLIEAISTLNPAMELVIKGRGMCARHHRSYGTMVKGRVRRIIRYVSQGI